MAHRGDGAGTRRCSYRRATAVVCSLNVLAALYVLHDLLNPYSLPSSSHGSASFARLRATPLRNANGTVLLRPVMRYTQEEIERIKEAHRARRAVEPLDLMKRVEEMQLEHEDSAARDMDAEVAKQKIAGDLAQRLNELRGRNPRSQDEALEVWRKKKMTESGKGKDSQVEELGSGPLPESVDLHIAEESRPEKVQGGKLVLTGPEIEDGIIPGRPLPEECNAEPHTDYDGVAVRWGLTNHQESAADCCEACLEQARTAKRGDMKCNVWVYCPAEEGCFSPDIYEHKQFECWLKQAETPRINNKGQYPPAYRQAHPNCPQIVAWASGVV